MRAPFLLPSASFEDDVEVDLERLTVGTATAARVLSFHPEYVRDLVRRNALKATKENGEYRIKFPDLVESLWCVRRPVAGMMMVPKDLPGVWPATLRELRETSVTVWRRGRRSKGREQEA